MPTSAAIKALADGDLAPVDDIVIVDTETSGLYADDGARVSTVSLAFEIPEPKRNLAVDLGFTVAREPYLPFNMTDEAGRKWGTDASSEWPWCASIAFPFDQGRDGKKEGRGQESMWPDAPNLEAGDWSSLLFDLMQWKLVFHNAKFDLEKLRVGVREGRFGPKSGGVDLEGNFHWDTQLAAKQIWPLGVDPRSGRLTTSLKPTSERYWGRESTLEADLIKKFLRGQNLPPGRYDLIPWDILGPYADQDARLTWKLYWWQQWWLDNVPDPADRFKLAAEIDREFVTMHSLYRQERRGLPYDSVESLRTAAELDKRSKAAAASLPFYPPTIVAAKSFFFGDADEWPKVAKRGQKGALLDPYSTTDKGSAQMTAEIVERMVLDEVKHAKEWAAFQKLGTANSMWYVGYADAIGSDGRLRTCFRQNGTASSRFSVERVNLQAIPHDYRLDGFDSLAGVPTPRQLIAKAVAEEMPDWDLWELDLAQAELRVAAMWARCQRMLDAIWEGRDLHGETATELFDVGSKSPDWGFYRQVGKRGNFTLCFGAGWKTFRAMVSKETGRILSPDQSMDIVRDWNALYPEYKRAIRNHSARVEARVAKHGYGWITLANGAKRHFQRFEDTHKAFNQRVQGSLAQYAIDWMNSTERKLSLAEIPQLGIKQGIGEAGLLLVIHDSQVLLLPKLGGDVMARDCAKAGEELWKEWFPGVPGAIDIKKWKVAA